jgi:hypothetical protein
MAISEQIGAKSELIVNTLVRTAYKYDENIDPAAGVYECDCNGFVGYVLSVVASVEAALIPIEPGQPRPRAFEYFDFFAALAPAASSGWQRIEALADARRGDILAWRSTTIEPGMDTGHVVVIAETPVPDISGAFYLVSVYDSAAQAHFDDTRAPGGVASAKGSTGVGFGVIHIRTDGAGRALAYVFAPPSTGQFSYRPIAIGRAEEPAA